MLSQEVTVIKDGQTRDSASFGILAWESVYSIAYYWRHWQNSEVSPSSSVTAYSNLTRLYSELVYRFALYQSSCN